MNEYNSYPLSCFISNLVMGFFFFFFGISNVVNISIWKKKKGVIFGLLSNCVIPNMNAVVFLYIYSAKKQKTKRLDF